MSYKSEIVEAANNLVESLFYNSDEEFVDDVISRIVNGERFDFDEIEEAESVEE